MEGPARVSPRVWSGVTEGPGVGSKAKGDRRGRCADTWGSVAGLLRVGIGGRPGSSMLLPVHAARREHWGLEGSEATLCDTVAVDTCH